MDQTEPEVDQKEKDKEWMEKYDFTSDQLAELKEVFNLLDEGGNGTIDAMQIGNALRAIGQNPTEQDCRSMIEECECNDDNTIDFEEFIRVVGARGLKGYYDMQEELEEAFKVFDKQGTGLLDVQELKEALKNLGEPVPEDEVNELLKMANVEGDGKFDFHGKLLSPYYFYF